MPASSLPATHTYSSLPALAPDIEIARAIELQPIATVAARAGIVPEELIPYGATKAKLSEALWRRVQGNPSGKLILVTAMTPTPAGEGKTVTSIGLAQALGRLGVRGMLALREPSLGPTFGIKGGAAGGGHAQVLPMDEINMHFTGDLHAVTSAHNLLAAALDNHIYHGNALGLDPERIAWRRVMDLCDRQLRFVEAGLGSPADGFPHRTGFDITASSEVMAILALAEDLPDLQARLARIVAGYNTSGQPVTAEQLGAAGAMAALLKDALQPNLVQTAEHTPALIHCGPFGNIAHGCNSIRATRLALKLADYVITEAGFAADLGAEKFLNIKCRQLGVWPAAAVLVATCRALKMHGGVPRESVNQENVAALKTGLANLRLHLENLRKFELPVVIAINRFPSDTPAELDAVFQFCTEQQCPAALSEVAARGGAGGEALTHAVLAAASSSNGAAPRPHYLYDPAAPLAQKIETIAREIYRADGVDYTSEALAAIAGLERLGFDKLPVCMAKTQMSTSDNPKLLGAPTGWRLTVRGLRLSAGAGFIVALTGKLLLMPGMPKEGNLPKIGVDAAGNIFGLS